MIQCDNSNMTSLNVCAGEKSTLERMMRRSKRSAVQPGGPHKKTKKKICQRYSMYVDFKEVGFNDWIRAPPGFDAFYCHGKCAFPLASHINASNHAVMQTLMNSYNPTLVPLSCCVPTKQSSQTLLYVDSDGKLVVKNYPDMSVDECGCRWGHCIHIITLCHDYTRPTQWYRWHCIYQCSCFCTLYFRLFF